MRQQGARLAAGADLADAPLQACLATPRAQPQPSAAAGARALMATAQQRPPAVSCQQALRLAFFFDGTGNNLDADVGTREHSNVARLFRAHPLNDESAGLYAFYIPGLGTYFKEIGDPGNETRGLAFGARGQDRLDWALNQFREKVRIAEARAQNPTNKIISIKVAVFGFSRGATAARAFCRELQVLCERAGDGWRLREGKYPVDLYFLGIFDTVASVGLPTSFNNTPPALGMGILSLESAMRTRDINGIGARDLAFGEPGADPAPGDRDGHGAWADPLAIVPMVSRCVHLVAAHENRNSFPVDSALNGNAYPTSVEEIVYPGAHSDVGGGYRAGEGGRSPYEGGLLSMVPLRVMYGKAREAGVPLYGLDYLATISVDRDFGGDPAGSKDFAALSRLFNHYMTTAGWGGGNVGQRLIAHMRLYYAWRFQSIRERTAAQARGETTAEEQRIRANDRIFAADRRQIDREVAQRQAALREGERRLSRARSRLQSAQLAQARFGTPVDPVLRAEADRQQGEVDTLRDAYLREKARLDTQPGSAEALLRSMSTYDRQLVRDAEAIRGRMQAERGVRLRPHYRALLEAYEAEFVRDAGLRDERIIAFFEEYVHDSLAGFASDATLPSDPRVIYIGGDVKLPYADLQRRDERATA